MKNFNLLLITLLTCCVTLSAQIEKTLVKSFDLDGSQLVRLDLPGKVEIKTWENETLRVQMTISLDTGTEAMLKSLVTAGRYNAKSDNQADGFRILMPGLVNELMVRGKTVTEQFTFIVFAPKKVTVQNLREAAVISSL